MLKLYDFTLSGNCYKARLMLSLLGLEHELVPVNLQKQEQKSAQFLQLNPLGKVPVLIDGDEVIRDSQAILIYLAQRYGNEDWLPMAAAPMSKVMQWLFVAANEIQHSVAAARRYYLLKEQTDIEPAQQQSYQILQLLNQHLQQRHWLAGDRPTIADIACFPYIGLAPDGKISLAAYLDVVAWIERVKQLPGYVGMPGL